MENNSNYKQLHDFNQSGLKFENFLRSEAFGWTILTLSGLFSGFGNSLESISMLAFLHIGFLLGGLEHLTTKNPASPLFLFKVFSFILVIQALGFCLGFSSMFGYPETSVQTTFAAFVAGFLAWFLFIIFALLPHLGFGRKYPQSPLLVFVFPTCHTFVTSSLIGSTFSVFTALGNSVLDYEPLRQTASLFGLASINYIVVLIATAAVLFSYRPLFRAHTRLCSLLFAGLTLLFIATGFLIQAGSFYQKNIEFEIVNSITVSCVTSQTSQKLSEGWNNVWNTTRNRINAGDSIVLMSEEALVVQSDLEESNIITVAHEIALQTQLNVAYVGVSFLKQLPNENFGTNHFALVSSADETAIWNYRKAHPVPLIESDILAGPANLPIHDSPFGRLAGSICFDMDFPQYILQAGRRQVDIMLQPSWTWNALNSRHFNGDSVRAIENGFTLFRCSSDGESGVVGPRGKVFQRQYVGHDPTKPSVFTLPCYKHVPTFFAAVGFSFEWICLVLAVLFSALIVLPKAWFQSWTLIGESN